MHKGGATARRVRPGHLFGPLLIQSRNPRFLHGPFPVGDMGNAPFHLLHILTYTTGTQHLGLGTVQTCQAQTGEKGGKATRAAEEKKAGRIQAKLKAIAPRAPRDKQKMQHLELLVLVPAGAKDARALKKDDLQCV